MRTFFSLLKAMLSQDMNLFKLNFEKNASKAKKILLPLIIGLCVMYSIGVYAYLMAEPLSKVGLTFVMLTMFVIIVSVSAFMSGIYKSQGMLFDCKDNDLLFSLPIKKSRIFLLRVLKLLIFQFIYNLIFMLPACAIYIYFENPGFNFYFISIIMLILLPIIPTIISTILGYIVKQLSTKFKAKKVMQTIFTFTLFALIFYLSMNVEDLIDNLVKNATSINDLLCKLYYPAGAYLNLINKFDIVIFIKLILIHIIPFIIVIYIGSINYFKIISLSSENRSISSTHKNKKTKIETKTPMKALIKKEFGRFISSPVYIFNSSFGLFLLAALTIGLCVNSNQTLAMFGATDDGMPLEETLNMLPSIYTYMVIFVSCMMSMTASSISIEGKSFSITKTLPIEEEKVLLSKILLSDILCIPLMLICDLLFVIKYDIALLDTIILIMMSIVVPTLTAIIGLLLNLKYPKMDANNDTEVVKQSLSVVLSVFIGLSMFILSIVPIIIWDVEISTILGIEVIIYILATIVMWNIIKKYGIKLYKKIIV